MASATRAPALPDQLMSGAERSFVTVGFSWTLAKGFLWRKRKRKAELMEGGGLERTGHRHSEQQLARPRDQQRLGRG